MNSLAHSNGTDHRVSVWPQARVDESIVPQQVSDEYVVYNLETNEVHQLNTTAATVWQWCDGRTSPSEMAERLSAAHGLSAEEAEPLLSLTLEKLGKADLLQGVSTQPQNAGGVSRRHLLRILGGASLLPVIYTITAPSAAYAQSDCVAQNDPCDPSIPNPCCAGLFCTPDEGFECLPPT